MDEWVFRIWNLSRCCRASRESEHAVLLLLLHLLLLLSFLQGPFSWRSVWRLDPQNEGAFWGDSVWSGVSGPLEGSLPSWHKTYGGKWMLCLFKDWIFTKFFMNYCYIFAFFRSVAFWGKAASCWQTTSSVLGLRSTWITYAAASSMRASTSDLTWSTRRWRTAWRSPSSWASCCWEQLCFVAVLACWRVNLVASDCVAPLFLKRVSNGN